MSSPGADRKQALRIDMMQRFRREKELEFSDATPVAPNFRGADQAVSRLASEPVFTKATVIFVTLDAALDRLRLRALESRKRLIAGDGDRFYQLDPDQIPQAHLAQAATRVGFPLFGKPIDASAIPPISLVVVAALAVDLSGSRLGDGSGSFDLAYATLREVGAISVKSPVVAMVHRSQVLDKPLPHEPFDTPIDMIVTPDHRLLTHTSHSRPSHRR